MTLVHGLTRPLTRSLVSPLTGESNTPEPIAWLPISATNVALSNSNRTATQITPNQLAVVISDRQVQVGDVNVFTIDQDLVSASGVFVLSWGLALAGDALGINSDGQFVDYSTGNKSLSVGVLTQGDQVVFESKQSGFFISVNGVSYSWDGVDGSAPAQDGQPTFAGFAPVSYSISTPEFGDLPSANWQVTILQGSFLSQATISAGESLLVKYPLKYDLNSAPAGSQGVLTSSQKIYRDASGKWVVADPNSPAVTGLSTLLEGTSTNRSTTNNNGSSAAGVTISSGDGAAATTATFSSVSGVDFSNVQPLIDDTTLLNVIVLDNSGGTLTTVYDFADDIATTNNKSISIFGASVGGTSTFSLSGAGPVNISGSKFNRFKSENITPSLASDVRQVSVPVGAICYVNLDQIEESSSIATSPIVVSGASATRLADGLQLPTAGWPVNDCAIYFQVVYAGSDAAFQRFFDTEIDANNGFQLRYRTDTQRISAINRVSGVNNIAEVIPSALSAGDVVEVFCKQVPDVGLTMAVSINRSDVVFDINSNMSDLQIGAVAQIAARAGISNYTNGLYSNPKVFPSSDVKLEDARYA